jgi:biopolymer transport protein ExbD
MWMKAMRQTDNANLAEKIKDGTGVAIKADQNTAFEVIHMVMDNLQTIHMNKFTLLTALKSGGDE